MIDFGLVFFCIATGALTLYVCSHSRNDNQADFSFLCGTVVVLVTVVALFTRIAMGV